MKSYPELQAIMDENPYLFEGLKPAREFTFREWLPRNMHIYKAFVRYAVQLKETKARKYYSARAIWERLRWDSMTADKPEGRFKLADTSMPFVSWLSMKAEPELEGMFQTRERSVGDE